MTGYYLVLDGFREELESTQFVNIVTEGLGDEIDLSKQTIFPLSHIHITDFAPKGNIVEFSLELYCMDIVDISDTEYQANKTEVLNTQYNVLLRVYESLRRGLLRDKGIEVVGFGATKFEQAYENLLTGWRANITVMIPNDMSIC
jgi:hypothetical protein